IRAQAGSDQRRGDVAVRVPHHQGHRSQGGPGGAVRRGGAADQAVSRGPEEAGEAERVRRRPEEEVEDRGPHLNEEVLPAAAAALERGEAAALVTIVRSTGSTP